MKTISRFYLAFLLFGFAPLCQAQQATPVPPPTQPSIASRSANGQVWEWTDYQKRPNGQMIPRNHHYTELCTGLNFKDPTTGQWVPSQEQISILPDGSAAATNGNHRAYFPANIGNGVIKLVTPDGLVLQSQPLGLSFDDGTNIALFAVLSNSVGQLISPNQVIYTNAFMGVDADLVYTYRKNGFEQDIIFRSQPPAPGQFGFDPANTHLQLLTEFFDPPVPKQLVSTISPQDGLEDTTLDFGTMKIVRGRAFLTDDAGLKDSNLNQAGVYKSWVVVNGRTLLVEELPYQTISGQLQKLPMPSAATSSPAKTSFNHGSTKWLLPPPRLVAAAVGTVHLARGNTIRKAGFVMDYNTVNSGETNFTFMGDTTYYLSGESDFSGTTVFEGGTVVKTTNPAVYTSMITILESGSVVCQTAPYRPAIFTSVNDNTIGETISGISTGSPDFQDNVWDLVVDGTNCSVHDMRFCYPLVAIAQNGDSTITATNCQFLNGCVAVFADSVGLYNVLIGDSASVSNEINSEEAAPQVYVEGSTLIAENVTADSGCGFIQADSPGETIALTNCLVTRQPLVEGYPATFQTNVVIWSQTPTAPVYQTVGAGNYYLANNSPYQGVGTTNIAPVLLADLREKTTYPPSTVISNIFISTNLVLSPQTPRDTNISAVDLGYHYDPIDYLYGGVCISNANATINPGTVIATFELDTFDSGLPYGLDVEGGGNFNSQGLANEPNRIVQFSTVQEGTPLTNWALPSPTLSLLLLSDCVQGLSTGAVFNVRFTDFSSFAQDDYLWAFANPNISPVNFRDSEFYSGYAYSGSANVTNCLFDRVQSEFESTSFSWIYNNLIYGGSFIVNYDLGVTNAAIVNNLFDVPVTSSDHISLPSGQSAGGYNAYYLSPLTNTYYPNARELTSPPLFQLGPLGAFYQATNQWTIYTGNTNANLLGFYHYTVMTNEIIDGTNIVSIGYHYVATDQYGNPLDSNGNGIPDYIEDTNGLGILGPQITLTAPATGSSFTEPATIPIHASVSDWSSPVTNVDFLQSNGLQGAISIVGITNVPYNYSWPIVAVGQYAVQGIAQDLSGLSATSSVVNVTVTNLCGY